MNKRQTLFLHKQCFWFNQVQVIGVYIYLAVSLFLKKEKKKIWVETVRFIFNLRETHRRLKQSLKFERSEEGLQREGEETR